jgi:hypothetical protein
MDIPSPREAFSLTKNSLYIKFLNFSLFCGQFWHAWIRIRNTGKHDPPFRISFLPLQGGSLLFLLMVTAEAGQPGTEAGQPGTEASQTGTDSGQKCQLLLATDLGNNPL